MSHDKHAERHGNHQVEHEEVKPVPEAQQLPEGPVGLSATSDIAAAAALAISKARAVVGQGWRKLVSDLATIP